MQWERLGVAAVVVIIVVIVIDIIIDNIIEIIIILTLLFKFYLVGSLGKLLGRTSPVNWNIRRQVAILLLQ